MAVNVDPYKVLRLDRNFTHEQLKKRYRELALQLHPDRVRHAGGSQAAVEAACTTFEVIHQCYQELAQTLESRKSDKSFDVLRAAARRENQETAEHRRAQATQMQAQWVQPDSKKFDVARFNKMFSENRISDAYQDHGYKGWMEEHDPDSKPPPTGAIINYKEPEPIMLGSLPFYELGVENVSDFSVEGAMDYRLAHTTSKLVDERVVATEGRQQYASVDELKQDRGNLSYTPDAAYLARRAVEEREAQEAEARRLAALQRQDWVWKTHFDRVKRLMLGPKAGAP